MNIERLKKQLIIDEGKKLTAYKDSLGYWTVGIGHLLTSKDPELMQLQIALKQNPKSTITISEQRCDELFKQDYEEALQGCRKVWKDFDNFCDEVQEICANMMFNLGRARFQGFRKMIVHVENKNYRLAAEEMEDSKWFRKDVPNRARRLQKRMIALSKCNVKESEI